MCWYHDLTKQNVCVMHHVSFFMKHLENVTDRDVQTLVQNIAEMELFGKYYDENPSKSIPDLSGPH